MTKDKKSNRYFREPKIKKELKEMFLYGLGTTTTKIRSINRGSKPNFISL